MVAGGGTVPRLQLRPTQARETRGAAGPLGLHYAEAPLLAVSCGTKETNRLAVFCPRPVYREHQRRVV